MGIQGHDGQRFGLAICIAVTIRYFHQPWVFWLLLRDEAMPDNKEKDEVSRGATPRAVSHSHGTRVFTHVLLRVLKPLATLAIRVGVDCDWTARVLRAAFVEAAEDATRRQGRRPTDVETQAITGLSRKSIASLRSRGLVDVKPQHAAAKVVRGWLSDPHFQQNEAPAVLDERQGAEQSVSFATLVKRYAPDVSRRALIDYLALNGQIERLGRRRIKLVSPTPLAAGALKQVGTGLRNIADHLATVVANVDAQNAPMVEDKYSGRIPIEAVPTVEAQLRDILSEAEQQARQVLDRYEASAEYFETATLGIGVFSIHHSDSNNDGLPGSRLL